MNWEVPTMQSKTSLFNGTLFKKNLKRFWPLWALTTFGAIMFPITYGLSISTRITMLEGKEALYEIASVPVPVTMFIYSIIVATVIWSYLYSPRSIGMFHSMPITRAGLFITNALSGLTIILIPYAAALLLGMIVLLTHGAFPAGGILVTIGVIIGEAVLFFGLATFIAFMVGHTAALPLLYVIFNFLAIALEYLFTNFVAGFSFGLNTTYKGALVFLSPLVNLLANVSTSVKSEYNYDLGHSVVLSVTLDHAPMVICYFVAGIVLLVLALLLYRTRKSESAGDVVAVGFLKPVLLYLFTAVVATLGGIILYEIFTYDLGSEYTRPLSMALCMCVAAAIGYYVGRMLLDRTVRVFKKKYLPGILVSMGCCFALCFILRYDLFGVQDYVPETSDIDRVEFTYGADKFMLHTGIDDEMISLIDDLHQSIVDDRTYILDHGYSQIENGNIAYYDVSFKYYLKSGKLVTRTYYVPIVDVRTDVAGTYDCLFKSIVNSTALRYMKIGADGSAKVTSTYIYYYNDSEREYVSLFNGEMLNGFTEALKKDIETTDVLGENVFRSDDTPVYYRVEFEIYVLNVSYTDNPADYEGYGTYYYASDYFYLATDMENTIAFMLENDLISEDELKACTMWDLY